MSTTAITTIVAVVLVNVLLAVVWFYLDNKKKKKEEESADHFAEPQQPPSGIAQTEQEPDQTAGTQYEPLPNDKPIKDLTPKFKVGDVITDGMNKYTITEVRKVCYVLDNGEYLPINEQDKWSLSEDDPDVDAPLFEDLINCFSAVVPLRGKSKTLVYLDEAYYEALYQYYQHTSRCGLPVLYKIENYPYILNFYTDVKYDYAFEKLCSWLFGLILSELVPEKRNTILKIAYEYASIGVPIYGWSFETDPNVCRDVAAFVWAITRDADKITEMRSEVGGSMLTYKKDISETFVDISRFLPPAPGPYLKEYSNRRGYPADELEPDYNTLEDREIHKYVSQYYSLDTKDAEKRQATIQAIANKEYKIPHLFGKPRTVTDPKYGQMTIYPVFGKHNIGIEIPEDSEIAKLCYEVGKASTDNRKSQLDQEYGRRRPGQGEKDGTANSDPKQRVLVNYSIEEGDGHSTGFYNQGGDYVSKDGVHIGDFETYFQSAVYANSYTSGHSAFIEGVAKVLAIVMPDRADLIIRAKNEFANSRIICRYHWQSDTTMGKLIGTMMLPIMFATTNCNMDHRINKCKEEYKELLKAA